MSFKNANKRFRKANLERSQPHHREKLGLLEKKKDYRKRARDYNEKKEKLRQLQEKAALRNADEFYFHMENSRMKDGVHLEADKSAESVKRRKTQDSVYLAMEKQKEDARIRKLKEELQFVGVERPSKHVIFVDSDEHEGAAHFDVAKFFDTDPRLLDRFHNRPRLKDLEKEDFEEPEEVQKSKRKQYKELASRVRRKKTIDEMLDKMDLEKKLLSKGEKKRFVNRDTGKITYKWEQVREK